MDLKARARHGLRSTRYVLGGLATALPSLAGYALLPLVCVALIVAPVLPWAIRPLRALADAERRRAEGRLGRPVRRPYPTPRGSARRQTLQLLRSPGTGKDVAWMLLHGMLGLILPVLVLGTLFCLLLTLSIPMWWWTLPSGTLTLLAAPLTTWLQAVVLSTVCVWIFALLFLWLAPAAARLETRVAEVLLGNWTGAGRRIEELTASRAGALQAHEAELRRIERDLHDGTQAQLVAVALRLGLADRRFDKDPASARELMLDARTTVDEALVQLRTVIRGIHPPILSDRGLNGAIRSLAAGRTVPVALDLPEPARRPPAAVEAAAYFVVAEALTNIARHSEARQARVSLRYERAGLRVLVQDDGRGGAVPGSGEGSGLDGVRQRVAALDGTTRIDSPVGSGTTIEVVLPCGL
ncbi:sensor histidine kinase [Streptomyces griseus]|uniref:sensor histidine kinase n=1 Tax=Streptomyces griseus TaxID=1911 RepID=UPI0004C96B41|nr:sensor histidine kinase [Streptomyces griseus]